MFPWPVYCTVLYCTVPSHHYGGMSPLSRKLCHQNTSSARDDWREHHKIKPGAAIASASTLHTCTSTEIRVTPSSHTSLHASYCKPLNRVRKTTNGEEHDCDMWQRCERLRHEMYICGWHEVCVIAVTLVLTCWRWVILVQIHSSHNINIAAINEALNAESSVQSRGGERQERQTRVI